MKNGDYLLVKAPSEYPGKKYRGKYCYEHHLVYWENTGVVPNNDEVIHHIDENKHNNNFDNLELKKKNIHNREHMTAKGRKYVILKCPACKKKFERLHSSTHLSKKGIFTSCSRECKNRLLASKENEFCISDNVILVYVKFPFKNSRGGSSAGRARD